MPRSAEAALAKVLAFIQGRADGATSNDVATALDVPERTARRYLSTLFQERKITRTAEYAGDPVVTFHYRYRVGEAKPRKK